jgi:hemerythrin-like metal-binding protein
MRPEQIVEDAHTGDPSVDGEHAAQLQFLDAIERALASADRENALALMGQLDVLTEAHFASEQILMRYHSYPGYWHHEEEHGHLMEELRDLRERISGAEPTHLAAEAGAIRQWLLSHMRSSDVSFAAFLATSPGGPK